LFAVVVVRGILPWLIVWLATPGLGPIDSLFAAFSGDPHIVKAVETSAPILLSGGGVFLVFLFFHWYFLEPKEYGLVGEKFFHKQGVWFYAVVSIILTFVVWFGLGQNPMMAFGAVVGSTVFFITHGFKQNAELNERDLTSDKSSLSDVSKIMYLEILDSTFSIDGVLGAFAFTFSVPLIVLGNGIGALVLRQFTIGNIDKIKKYIYLKNGAMYSILFLGIKFEAELEKPDKPDIRLSRIFDAPVQILGILLPSRFFKPLIKRRFLSMIDWEIEKNRMGIEKTIIII